MAQDNGRRNKSPLSLFFSVLMPFLTPQGLHTFWNSCMHFISTVMLNYGQCTLHSYPNYIGRFGSARLNSSRVRVPETIQSRAWCRQPPKSLTCNTFPLSLGDGDCDRSLVLDTDCCKCNLLTYNPRIIKRSFRHGQLSVKTWRTGSAKPSFKPEHGE